MAPTGRAFVLSGGGARGALQVGALRALLESGIQPDMVLGTSIGGVNAAFLSMHGFREETLAALEDAWRDAAEADLLPDNYLWLTIRMLFNRSGSDVQHHIRSFFVDHGISPELRFGQLPGPRLTLVAADLRAGCTVLYGADPNQSVLNGMLASTAILPWVRPLEEDNRLLMDGGVVSNLPIEPALVSGATEIIALDLSDPRPVLPSARGPGPFLYQLLHTVEVRQIHLEKQLAAAQGVPVYHVELLPQTPVAVWEFPRAVPLIEQGYTLMKRYLLEHPELTSPAAQTKVPWWRRAWSSLVDRKSSGRGTQ
jgi:NTE family protein